MREFNIADFGAIGDGKTLNTKAIQSAIDVCAESGGGKVLIGGGVYMSGSITLKSGVNLHIEQDGVLLGSPDCADYPEKENLKHIDSFGLPRHKNASFIFAEECENISITGMGKIDCNGISFTVEKQGEWQGWKYVRIDAPTPPRVVFFTGCKNIKIQDITMVNQPAGWSYWIHNCEYVSFNRCNIIADVEYPNNDGIHINSSRNVTVSHCNITCGDDCVVVRANNRSLKENKVCERVTVSDCNLTSYSGGIRIGWMSDGVIRNCVFSNIVMTDTTCGIDIFLPKYNEEIADKGIQDTIIENLSFSNIVMDYIYGKPVKIDVGQTPETRCKAIRNLHFNSIHARGLEFPLLNGKKDCKLKNITFSDCTFEKVSDESMPGVEHHGPAAWSKTAHCAENWVTNAENVILNNTIFSSEE